MPLSGAVAPKQSKLFYIKEPLLNYSVDGLIILYYLVFVNGNRQLNEHIILLSQVYDLDGFLFGYGKIEAWDMTLH